MTKCTMNYSQECRQRDKSDHSLDVSVSANCRYALISHGSCRRGDYTGHSTELYATMGISSQVRCRRPAAARTVRSSGPCISSSQTNTDDQEGRASLGARVQFTHSSTGTYTQHALASGLNFHRRRTGDFYNPFTLPPNVMSLFRNGFLKNKIRIKG